MHIQNTKYSIVYTFCYHFYCLHTNNTMFCVHNVISTLRTLKMLKRCCLCLVQKKIRMKFIEWKTERKRKESIEWIWFGYRERKTATFEKKITQSKIWRRKAKNEMRKIRKTEKAHSTTNSQCIPVPVSVFIVLTWDLFHVLKSRRRKKTNLCLNKSKDEVKNKRRNIPNKIRRISGS